MRGLAVALAVTITAACGSASEPEPAATSEPTAEPTAEQTSEVSFPTSGSTMTLVVPFPPGGGVDATARALASGLSEELGINVVVENREGAGGTLGSDYVYRADPDGYTLLALNTPILAVSELIAGANFEALAFEPIHAFAEETATISVRADSPYETLDDLIAASQETRLTHSNPGAGTAMAFQSAILAESIPELQFLDIAYEGGGPQMQALLGGEADFSLVTHTAVSASDEIRPLASIQAERHANTPDTPTVSELGFEVISVPQIRALWAPPGTPEEILDILEAAMAAVVAGTGWTEFAATGGYTVTPYTRAEMQEFDRQAFEIVQTQLEN